MKVYLGVCHSSVEQVKLHSPSDTLIEMDTALKSLPCAIQSVFEVQRLNNITSLRDSATMHYDVFGRLSHSWGTATSHSFSDIISVLQYTSRYGWLTTHTSQHFMLSSQVSAVLQGTQGHFFMAQKYILILRLIRILLTQWDTKKRVCSEILHLTPGPYLFVQWHLNCKIKLTNTCDATWSDIYAQSQMLWSFCLGYLGSNNTVSMIWTN